MGSIRVNVLGRSIGKYLMLFSTNVSVMVSATAKCSDPIRHYIAKWAPGKVKAFRSHSRKFADAHKTFRNVAFTPQSHISFPPPSP